MGHNRVFQNPYPTCSCIHRCSCCKIQNYTDIYQRILEFRPPSRVFEWGPGENTRLALAQGAKVTSVEQDARWLLEPQANLEQVVIDSLDPRYTTTLGVYDADLYFVDSRWRAQCVYYIAKNAVTPDHAVFLHDAQRLRYHWALRYYRYVRFIAPGNVVASNSDWILALPGEGNDAV